jgi:hypothetical protein
MLDFGDRIHWRPSTPTGPPGPPCSHCRRPMYATEHDFGERYGLRMVWWCDDHPTAFRGRVS